MGVAAKVNPSETSLLTFRFGFDGKMCSILDTFGKSKSSQAAIFRGCSRCEYQTFDRAYHLAMTRRTTPMQREVKTTTGLAEAISLDQDHVEGGMRSETRRGYQA